MIAPELIAGGFILLGIVIAYLVGSIPDGVIVGKLYAGVDVRRHGSGNIGTTNTLRLAGWGAGVLVGVLDILKGVVSTLLMMLILWLTSSAFAEELGTIYDAYASGWLHDLGMGLAMIFAVIGHMYSPFLKFKGGKGIATSFGGFIVVVPWCSLVSLAAFLIFCVITKYVSVGSLAGAIGFLLGTCIIYWQHVALIPIAVVLTILVFYAHRSNLKRLVRGEESKFSVGSRKTAQDARELELKEDARLRAEKAGLDASRDASDENRRDGGISDDSR